MSDGEPAAEPQGDALCCADSLPLAERAPELAEPLLLTLELPLSEPLPDDELLEDTDDEPRAEADADVDREIRGERDWVPEAHGTLDADVTDEDEGVIVREGPDDSVTECVTLSDGLCD